MDCTTPKGYLDIVARNYRPGTIIVQQIIEEHLGQGVLPTEDGIIYISTTAKGNGFPHEDIRKNLQKLYKKAGWEDLLFYKNSGDLFTIKLVLPKT